MVTDIQANIEMATKPEIATTPRYIPVPEGPMHIEPVILEGEHIRLEPLTVNHLDALCEIAFDEDIWRWVSTQVRNRDDMRGWLESALAMQAQGTALPFATIEKSSNRVVGSTRFANIDKANYHVEIGWTWIGRQWQRTFVNTEAKYLMLRHAFETLGCLRVELKTDFFNQRSRNAILRIGAKQEGIFRNHMIMPGGRVRDSVYFSIVNSEWSEVKANLEAKLSKSY